jgi:hypothetical protein
MSSSIVKLRSSLIHCLVTFTLGVENKENNKAVSHQDIVEEAPFTPQKKAPKSQSASATKPPSGKSINSKKAPSSPITEEGKLVNPTSLFASESRVKKVYKIVQKSTGALGGNGYNGAIYGELTLHSMQKVRGVLTTATTAAATTAAAAVNNQGYHNNNVSIFFFNCCVPRHLSISS